MGRHHGVPSRGGGGLTDAKTVDYHAGFESMLVNAAAAWSGVDVVLHAAGILESYSTISPEKSVLDCEPLRFIDRFQAGSTIDEETLALDLIGSTHLDDHLLGGSNTLERASEAFLIPQVVDNRSHGVWKGDGELTPFDLGNHRVQEQLDAYERPELDADIQADLDALAEAKKREILEDAA